MMNESRRDEGKQIQETSHADRYFHLSNSASSRRHSSNRIEPYPTGLSPAQKLIPQNCPSLPSDKMVGKIIKHNQTICNLKAI